MLILIGPSPASCAAAIPSRTLATGKSTPFIAENVASSSESRLTVTRCSPASREGAGERPQGRPVRRQRQVERPAVRSAERGEHPDQDRQVAPDERLAAGDPQLLAPSATNDARRAARSPRRSGPASRGRNAKSGPKISFGMQYVQRKLQRSVTEIRRSWSGRPSRSVTAFEAAGPGSSMADTSLSYARRRERTSGRPGVDTMHQDDVTISADFRRGPATPPGTRTAGRANAGATRWARDTRSAGPLERAGRRTRDRHRTSEVRVRGCPVRPGTTGT